MKRMPKLLTEKFSINVLVTGIIFLGISIILFIWQDWTFNIKNVINTQKISQFGDFVGGLIGSLWALAGVILFYVALTEQRNDFKTNREVLNTQAEALKQQINEFELQRKELSETRKIYQIQSETLKKQQFESTFFNLINLHHQIVNSIDLKSTGKAGFVNTNMNASEITTGRDCFVKFTSGLKNVYSGNVENTKSFIDERQLINKSYLEYYEKHQSDLGHYFRNLYHIIKFIYNSEVENKKTYIGLVRAQLSNDELVMLFYNCISDYGAKKFMPMAHEYNLFKNLNSRTLLVPSHWEILKEYVENE
tara:strand:- start:8000 stop:8920 length:921 start_codon:yes stop_codon:yes gene_type:complete